MACIRLTELTIPNSVTNISKDAFSYCSQLQVIIIDASDTQTYERISNLIPKESRHLIMHFKVWEQIKKAREQALTFVGAIGIDSFPKNAPEIIIELIQQVEGNLHHVINQVPFPRYLVEQFEPYTHDLQEALNDFRQKQEYLHQRLAALNKLEQVIQRTEEALAGASRKNPAFFASAQNESKLNESRKRITVASKLIKWLGDEEAISFTENEKLLLHHSKSSIALILQNYRISGDFLAPSSTHAEPSSSIKKSV